MRLYHEQPDALEAGRLSGHHLHHRHAARQQEDLRHQGDRGPERQVDRAVARHDEREGGQGGDPGEGSQRQGHDGQGPSAGMAGTGDRTGRRLRDRPRAALRPHQQVEGPERVPGDRPVPELRPLRDHGAAERFQLPADRQHGAGGPDALGRDEQDLRQVVQPGPDQHQHAAERHAQDGVRDPGAAVLTAPGAGASGGAPAGISLPCACVAPSGEGRACSTIGTGASFSRIPTSDGFGPVSDGRSPRPARPG